MTLASSSLFSRRTPLTGGIIEHGRAPQDMLPIEMWESVFCWVSPDADLLTVAVVCRVFLELCVRIYLHRQNCTKETLSEIQLRLPSHILRALALYLPFRTLPAQQLVCELESPEIHRQLRCIQKLTTKAGGLREISLLFGDGLVPSPLCGSLLDTFCSTLSGVARRISGPVFVVLQSQIFSCRGKDIAHWRLDHFQYNFPSAVRRLVSAPVRRRFNDKRPHDCTTTRYHNGRIGTVKTLNKLHSATLQLIPVNNSVSLPSFSILTFDMDKITYLCLGLPREGGQAALVPYLSALVAHITFPSLYSFNLYTDTVDPAALHSFLVRHTTIQRVEYRNDRSKGGGLPRPFIEPSLAHPSLTSIQTWVQGKNSAGRLIPTLITSPNLRRFGYSSPGSITTQNAAGLLCDLRCIAARGGNADVSLDFQSEAYIHSPPVPEHKFWASSAETREVAGTLYCVQSVRVTTFSATTARWMLPWLALLPAHVQVFFSLSLNFKDGKRVSQDEANNEGEKFRREARAVLPHASVASRVW
ncbi:hypothetical protein B0H13DRAFT_2030472 [Mycena leptocephala]|nr:hypothetical protein B0H13DRAFT_2030472 [Mycena leptocephala]